MALHDAFEKFLRAPVLVSSLMSEISDLDTLDLFSANLYNVWDQLGLTQTALRAIGEYEISKRDNASQVFRIDDMPTKIFRLFQQNQGKNYLTNLVHVIFTSKMVTAAANAKDEEIPAKIRDIFLWVAKILVGSSVYIPQEMKDTCKEISQMMLKKFGEGADRTFLVGYFFVRFLAPALAMPDSLSLNLELTRAKRKIGVLLSKMLKTAASGQIFETENMQFANEYLSRGQSKILVFLAGLCEDELGSSQRKLKLDCEKTFRKVESSFQREISDDPTTWSSYSSMVAVINYFGEKEFIIRKQILSKDLSPEEMRGLLEILSQLKKALKQEEEGAASQILFDDSTTDSSEPLTELDDQISHFSPVFGASRLADKVSLPVQQLRPQEALKRLFLSPAALSVFLESDIPDMETFFHHFYHLCYAFQITSPAILGLAMNEIEKRDNPFQVFRIDSFSTKFLKKSSQTMASHYLACLIQNFFSIQGNKGFDVNAAEASNEIIGNSFLLLLRMLVGSTDHIPQEMKEICQEISRMMNTKFGSGSHRMFLAGYFFVRFLCPALVMPESISVKLNLNPGMKRLSVMVSKMLQSAASGQTFESSSMQFANEYLSKGQTMLEVFLNELCLEELSESQQIVKDECAEFGKMAPNEKKGEEGSLISSLVYVARHFAVKGLELQSKLMWRDLRGENCETDIEVILDVRRTLIKESGIEDEVQKRGTRDMNFLQTDAVGPRSRKRRFTMREKKRKIKIDQAAPDPTQPFPSQPFFIDSCNEIPKEFRTLFFEVVSEPPSKCAFSKFFSELSLEEKSEFLPAKAGFTGIKATLLKLVDLLIKGQSLSPSALKLIQTFITMVNIAPTARSEVGDLASSEGFGTIRSRSFPWREQDTMKKKSKKKFMKESESFDQSDRYSEVISPTGSFDTASTFSTRSEIASATTKPKKKYRRSRTPRSIPDLYQMNQMAEATVEETETSKFDGTDVKTEKEKPLEEEKTPVESDLKVEETAVDDRKVVSPSGVHQVKFLNAKVTRVLAPMGGSGAAVYCCDVDGMSCAMKEFCFYERPQKNLLERFKKEIEVIEELSHPNIVQYLHHSFRRTSVRLFLTRYESSLRQEVKKRLQEVREDLEDPFNCREIFMTMYDIAKGLRYLHLNKIIHRDLKTDNIFVNFGDRGELASAVIGDFDSAKLLAGGQAKTITGTTNYIAPQIMKMIVTPSLTFYTVKADIWSFGMVLYELLTLQLPYGELHMSDALARIKEGQRPIVPGAAGFPDAQSLPDSQELIEIFEHCSMYEEEERPTAAELCDVIGDKYSNLF